MVYESSYESGRRPFLPDSKRGYWSNPTDFVYAGLGLAFRLDVFSIAWFYSLKRGFIATMPLHLISVVFYTIPFMIIQSFMGQFSSSGFISAFRLAPLFKGIGYVTLPINISVIAYTSVFAMVPLVYMFASMKPTLPWSCEGFKQWAHNLTEKEENNLCNLKIPNDTETPISFNDTVDYDYDFVNHHIPSVMYFKTLFNDLDMFTCNDVEFSMSWQLILCAILVWTIVTVFVLKFFNTEKFGEITRYAVWTLSGLLMLFVIRFSFLPGSHTVYSEAFSPSWTGFLNGFFAIPVNGLSTFGPGWGLFITLSSFNTFKTDIIKYSWVIGFGQLLITLGLDMLIHFTDEYFTAVTDDNYYSRVDHIWTLYLGSGSVMAHMFWANLWSILFFFMLFLAAMLMIIMQLFSILITIFDEFDFLRERKLEVSLHLVGIMAALSLYFTSNHGVTYITAFLGDTFTTQSFINLLLIPIVLWIYGRVRLQRDIEFMTNRRFSNWNIYILRSVTPLGMLFALAVAIEISRWGHMVSSFLVDLYIIIAIVLPWLCIPGYAIYCMSQKMGPIKSRFLKCCRPTDWYPVEAEYRQQYEQAIGNADMTQTLNEVKEDEVL